MRAERASEMTRLGLVALMALTMCARPAAGWWFSADSSSSSSSTSSTSAPLGQHQQQANEMRAAARFDLDGVKGQISFAQRSPKQPTRVEYDLTGLKGNNRLYHVHVRPVPEHQHGDQQAANASALCADANTGGHLNPHKITQKLPPKSAPLDQYELGDLSGKHGPLLELAGQPDRYVGQYTDDQLPMWGEHSIVGRSVVIHKNDGKRWVCASIVPVLA